MNLYKTSFLASDDEHQRDAKPKMNRILAVSLGTLLAGPARVRSCQSLLASKTDSVTSAHFLKEARKTG